MTDMSWADAYTARCEACGAMALGSTVESLEQWRRQHAETCEGES